MRGLNFFKKAILTAAVALASTQISIAESLADLPVKTVGGRDYYTYEVVPKDTPFRLSQRFGITVDDIIKYNPAVKDGLKAYSTLYFPVDAFNGSTTSRHTAAQTSGNFTEVTIQPGQTLFSIAEKHGTTVDAILDANPGLKRDTYRAGTVIKVPATTPLVADARESSSRQPAPAQQPQPQPGQRQQAPAADSPAVQPSASAAPTVVTEVVEETEEPDTLSITLMLPLESGTDNPSRVGQLYMEFYRGFLLGLEEKSRQGMPVKVRVIDTAVADADYSRMLQSEQIASTDLFIGPDKEQQLVELAAVANTTGAYIINPFVIKDELVHSNPSIVQTNIPRNEMYAGAIEKFISLYPATTTVFLSRVDGEADKAAFTEQMKERLDEAERPYREIVYQGVLTDDDLAALDPKASYVFVPVSASRNEFGKFVSGIKEFRNRITMEGGDTSLFGYPEWTTLRGDQLEQLRALNTVIYSRFINSDDYKVNNLKNAYKRWYGKEWADVEPNQSLLGYDTALFAVENLRKGEGDLFPSATAPFNGVQSSFVLGQPFEGAGYVNGAMYVIKYRPYGNIEAEVVTVPVTLKLAR